MSRGIRISATSAQVDRAARFAFRELAPDNGTLAGIEGQTAVKIVSSETSNPGVIFNVTGGGANRVHGRGPAGGMSVTTQGGFPALASNLQIRVPKMWTVSPYVEEEGLTPDGRFTTCYIYGRVTGLDLGIHKESIFRLHLASTSFASFPFHELPNLEYLYFASPYMREIDLSANPLLDYLYLIAPLEQLEFSPFGANLDALTVRHSLCEHFDLAPVAAGATVDLSHSDRLESLRAVGWSTDSGHYDPMNPSHMSAGVDLALCHALTGAAQNQFFEDLAPGTGIIRIPQKAGADYTIATGKGYTITHLDADF